MPLPLGQEHVHGYFPASSAPAKCHILESGTPESNRDPPAPKAGVLPSAPLPDVAAVNVKLSFQHVLTKKPGAGDTGFKWIPLRIELVSPVRCSFWLREACLIIGLRTEAAKVAGDNCFASHHRSEVP